MKVFMDMSDYYPDLKIIAIGAVDTPRQVIEYDQEMRNRVSEIYVPLMTDEELIRIPDKGEELLNFAIPPDVKYNIVSFSNGLASVCHQLCLNICFTTGIYETLHHHQRVRKADLDRALESYLDNASDTLKNAFYKAIRRNKTKRFDNGKLILWALMKCDQEGATHAEILTRIREVEPEYPARNLTSYIKQLQMKERGAVIRYETASRKYSFSDPVYCAFTRVAFGKEASGQKTFNEIIKDIMHQLRSASS